MPRYAVALFLRKEENASSTERLQIRTLKAKSAAEALGSFIRCKDREFNNFPIVYHVVQEL